MPISDQPDKNGPDKNGSGWLILIADDRLAETVRRPKPLRVGALCLVTMFETPLFHAALYPAPWDSERRPESSVA